MPFRMPERRPDKPYPRSLPVGTRVKLKSLAVRETTWKQKVVTGPKKGEIHPVLKLVAVLEPLERGDTEPFESKGPNGTKSYPSVPFGPETTFAQFMGGVYPAEDGENLNEGSPARLFMEALIEAAGNRGDEYDDYAGLDFEIDHVEVHNTVIAVARAPGQDGPAI